MNHCPKPGCPRLSRNQSGGLCQACHRRKRRAENPDVRQRANESVRRAYEKRVGRPVTPRPERTPEERAMRKAESKRAAWRRSKGAPASPERKVGPCEICGQHAEPLCLDHCHATGAFRGWLCRKCNAGLGHFRDSAVLVRLALAYLETRVICKVPEGPPSE